MAITMTADAQPRSLRPELGDRSLFPALEPHAYLNHAAVSPPSAPVQAAATALLADYGARGLTAAIAAAGLRQRLREQLAQLLGAEADDIGLIQSTTAGVVAIARSITFRAGDRVLLFEGEFPANVTPWQAVAQERALGLLRVPLAPFFRSTAEGLMHVEQALRQGVRLVAVSAVQFQSGLRMPLRELSTLCHAYGAELFVDAIQGLGALPLDVAALELDYLVAGGHKFLMGLEGVGVLYVRRAAMQRLSLGLAGWTGHEDAFSFLQGEPGLLRHDRAVLRRASFVEQGALSMVGCAALSASLSILLTLGVEAIFAHVTRYLDALEAGLCALGLRSLRASDAARRSASLCMQLPERLSAADFVRVGGRRCRHLHA